MRQVRCNFKNTHRKELNYIQEFFQLTAGAKYDFKGILLSQFLFPFEKEDTTRFFCSEWVETALRLTLGLEKVDKLFLKGYKFSPNRLFTYLKKYDIIETCDERVFVEV